MTGALARINLHGLMRILEVSTKTANARVQPGTQAQPE
jgi:hypothetical protein